MGCDVEFNIFINIEKSLKIFFQKPNYLTGTSCVNTTACRCSVNLFTLNYNPLR